jgi:hypothetical protein
MKDISKKRLEISKQLGDKAENLFIKLMSDYLKSKNKKVNIKKSTPYEDKNYHIDYYINGGSFDIKARRHLETIWLEKKNINGNDGWLLGKVQYIAFDIIELKSFCIFKRIDLYNHIKNINEYTTNKFEHNKIYTRSKWGKKDELIKVKYEEIKHLEVLKLTYNKQTKLF